MRLNVSHAAKSICIAAIYAGFLVNIDAIFGISETNIKDRLNYINYFYGSAHLIDSSANQGLLDTLASEPVFVVIWYSLSLIARDSSNALAILIFVSSFLTAFVILERREIPFLWRVLILFFPWLIVNYIVNLRQGVAIAFFLYAHFHLNGRWKFLVYAITPLIHYSFLLIVGIFAIAHVLKKAKIANSIRMIISHATVMTVAAILLAIFARWVVVPVRELEVLFIRYADSVSPQFGFGVIYWGIVWIIFVTSKKTFIKDNIVSILSIGLYLSLVVFFPPVSRIIQNMAPFILLAGFQLGGFRLAAFKLLFTFHIVLFWVSSIYLRGPSGMIVGDS